MLGQPMIYVDENENTYCGQVVGYSQEWRVVYRKDGKEVAAPPPGQQPDPGVTYAKEYLKTGGVEFHGTYADGTVKHFSNLAPEKLRGPELPAAREYDPSHA
jgi:hypothetical protein